MADHPKFSDFANGDVKLGWLCHCDSFHLASRYILDNKDVTKMMALHSEHLGIENPLQNYMRKHHAVL